MKLTEAKILINTLREKYQPFQGGKYADMILKICAEHEKLLTLLQDKVNEKTKKGDK